MYATDSNPLTYRLLKIESNKRLEISEVSYNVKLHESCSVPGLANKDGFFCINNDTGRIYSTSKLGLVKLTVATHFTFSINIIDSTVYPMRNKILQLKLIIKDKCSPASNTYNLFQTCVDYKDIPGSTIKDDTLTFYPSQQIQRVLGFKFDIAEVDLPPGAAVKAELQTYAPNGAILEFGISLQSSIGDKNENNNQSLSVYLPRMSVGEISAKLLKYDVDAWDTVNITGKNPSKFTVLTMISYQCEKKSCLQTYNRWINESKLASERSGADCTKDPKFYATNFKACFGKFRSYLMFSDETLAKF